MEKIVLEPISYASYDPFSILHNDTQIVTDIYNENVNRLVIDSPDFVSRVRIGSGTETLDSSVDAVFRCVLNGPTGYVYFPVPEDVRPKGYVYVPVPEEKLDRNKLLATEKATLWLSTEKLGGIGRTVDLTKKSVNKTDTDPIPDVDRQNELDLEFMKLKFALGLGERDGYPMVVVNYSINSPSIEIYNDEGILQGTYDLMGSGEGIKQLLRDRGMPHDTDRVEKLLKDLGAINQRIKNLIKHETGGKYETSSLVESKSLGFYHQLLGTSYKDTKGEAMQVTNTRITPARLSEIWSKIKRALRL